MFLNAPHDVQGKPPTSMCAVSREKSRIKVFLATYAGGVIAIDEKSVFFF